MEYGLIGEKLGHSYSKQIHSSFADYEYVLKEIPKDELDAFMTAHDFKAINVTIPYKEKVIPYLDYIDKNAEEIGAVNTIVNHNGTLKGYNTDFYGMIALIKKNGIELSGKKVLILGTGGTSKTSCCVAKSLGSAQILVVSRTPKDGVITYEEAYSDHSDADIIINTTPVGMFPKEEAAPVDLDKFSKLSGVVDAIFNPLRSNLVLAAEQKGIPACGGLYMLSAQAVYAFGHFTGSEPNESFIEKAYRDVMFGVRNIVLIGMPSAGKSTIGKALARKTGKEFVDSDNVITERIGCTISEFFATHGEKAFRDLETEVIKELSHTGNKIIATGGGAILRPENVQALKRNGIIIMIDRSIDNLTPTADRPLLQNREMLEKLFADRYEIYKNNADVIIDGNRPIFDVTELAYKSALEVM